MSEVNLITLGVSFLFSLAAFVYAWRADSRASRAEALATKADARAERAEVRDQGSARLQMLERISTTIHDMAHAHVDALGGDTKAIGAGARRRARLVELLNTAPVPLPECAGLLTAASPLPDFPSALAEVEAAIGAEQQKLGT